MRVVALCALALSVGATPAWADTAASLQILQGCLDASASAPGAGTASPVPSNHHAGGAQIRLSIGTGSAPGPPRAQRRTPGVVDLTARCPQLSQALSDLGFTRQLSTWNGRLDRGAVADLLRAARRYEAGMPSGAPALALLPIALARLQVPAPPPRSWWQRLKEQLREWFEQPGGSGSDWLQQWLSRLSIPLLVQRLILYGTTAAVLIMAAWLIARELRTARLTPRRPTRRVGGAARVAQERPRPLTLADIDGAPPAERSIVLLRLLVQALLQSGRLSAERALTYRELSARGVFDDAAQRERFARLARIAERDRYGTRPEVLAGSAAAPAAAAPVAAAPGPAAALAVTGESLGEGRALYQQLLEPRTLVRAQPRVEERGAAEGRRS
jgi:hypothetical protein